MFLFYPVILICITAALIFLPAPTLFYRSRRWFLYSNVKFQRASPQIYADRNSGDYSSPAFTLSSSVTSSWGICSAPLRTALA
jgi:hypothetical protein